MKKAKPSDLELQVLSVLWRQGPLTARQVLEEMPDGKKRAYTTILSVMQVMEKKGLLKHKRQGQAYVFTPTVSKGQVIGPLLRGLVANVFGGRPTEAMMHLLDVSQVSDEELHEMRKLLETHEKQDDSSSDMGAGQ